MFLKRIELQGFKSFADKTVIQFDQDITGIVPVFRGLHHKCLEAILRKS